MNTVSMVFLLVLALSSGLQAWLVRRNWLFVQSCRARVPESFADVVPLETHHKAADYTAAKSRLGLIELAYEALLLVGWTLGGGLNLLDEFWRGFGWDAVATGVGVLVSAFIIMAVLDLPFSVYQTFSIEQRFGFNRTSIATFAFDLCKNAALLTALGVPLIWAILWLMEKSGDLWWLYVWFLWTGFSLLMMWAYPAFIAPLFNKFEALPDADLQRRIQQLLEKCGFASNGIFVMDGSRRSGHGNAYFTGLGNNKRIVFFDTLIESLEPQEIEAVLAHELGHFRLKHIQKRIITTALLSLAGLALLGWLMGQHWLFSGLGVAHASTYIALLLYLMIAPLAGTFVQPLFSAFSRRHEFEADAYAAEQADAQDLIRALVKLYKENATSLTPDPLYSAFHDSHPPAPVRVARLSAKIRA